MKDRPTVLVVDDESDLRESVRKMLLREGCSVLTALDGEDALDALYSLGPVDLIVLDLMMPKVNGFEFMDSLGATPFKDVPVLVLTAKSAPRDIGLSYSKGADLYLRKPFEPEVLLKAVQYLTLPACEQRTQLEAYLMERDEICVLAWES